jgi:hypothetical protein
MENRPAATDAALAEMKRCTDAGGHRHVFEKDSQIESRWDNEIRIEPYRWLDGNGHPLLEDQADFIGIVNAMQRVSPIPFSSNLDVSGDDDERVDSAALRFFYASQGVIGFFKKLHKMALREADRATSCPREIDLALLEAAYAAAFRYKQKGMENPFAPNWSPFAADGTPRLPPPVEDDTLLLNPLPRRRPTKRQRKQELMHSLTKG